MRLFFVSSAVLLAAGASIHAAAGGTLRDARIQVAMTSPVACEVEVAYSVDLDAPGPVEHRVQLADGASVELAGVTGTGVEAGPATVIGRTQSLTVRVPDAGVSKYGFRYRATQPGGLPYRCPVWAPTLATDGIARTIAIELDLPPGAAPSGGSLPAFEWTGGHGTATLANVPALVRAPYTSGDGTSGPSHWDVARLMDLTAVATLVGASVLWVWRRKRA